MYCTFPLLEVASFYAGLITFYLVFCCGTPAQDGTQFQPLVFSCVRCCFEYNTRTLSVYLRNLSDNSNFLFHFFIFEYIFLAFITFERYHFQSGCDPVRVFSFWLAFLQILLIWISSDSFESIVIPRRLDAVIVNICNRFISRH